MANELPYWIFYVTLGVAAILPRMPLVGKYFQVFNTLIHENGHAIMALLTRGSARRIELFADTSGSVITSSRYKLSHFFTSLAGYPASAGAALLLFYLLNRQDEFTLLVAVSIILGLNLILFVRNAYGIIWLLSFGGLLYLLFYFNNLMAMRIAITFFAGVLFWGSIISPAFLVGLSWHSPKNAGDASNLNKLTGIPSLIWSLFFLAFALLTGWFTVQQFPMAGELISRIKDYLL